jgi:hypothetical protein
MRLIHCCLALSTLSPACRISVPKASPELDLAAKNFMAPSGKARIYVYQSRSGIIGTISVDERFVGVIRGNMYVVADVEPGRHVVLARSETDTTVSGGPLGSSTATVEAVTNAVHFVRLTSGWPFHAPPLKVVSDTEGRKAVLKARLASLTE